MCSFRAQCGLRERSYGAQRAWQNLGYFAAQDDSEYRAPWGLLWASMVPPCASMIVRVIVSPIP